MTRIFEEKRLWAVIAGMIFIIFATIVILSCAPQTQAQKDTKELVHYNKTATPNPKVGR